VRVSGRRRLLAWCADTGLVLGWAGVLAAVVLPRRSAPVLVALSEHPWAENAVAVAVLVAPVTAVLAWAEHRWGRTPGKRAAGLVVVGADGGPPSLGRALVRNAGKVALPWTLGHVGVYAVAGGAAPTVGTGAVLAAAYLVAVVWLGAAFTRRGRTPYDVLAGTWVCARPATAPAAA
jgi:uncharacterized RDD family membrane protein YckC